MRAVVATPESTMKFSFSADCGEVAVLDCGDWALEYAEKTSKQATARIEV
jgi:hypothetical protein